MDNVTFYKFQIKRLHAILGKLRGKIREAKIKFWPVKKAYLYCKS